MAHEMDEAFREWLKAKKIITDALVEWRFVAQSEADRFAAAILARLAQANMLVEEVKADGKA